MIPQDYKVGLVGLGNGERSLRSGDTRVLMHRVTGVHSALVYDRNRHIIEIGHELFDSKADQERLHFAIPL